MVLPLKGLVRLLSMDELLAQFEEARKVAWKTHEKDVDLRMKYEDLRAKYEQQCEHAKSRYLEYSSGHAPEEEIRELNIAGNIAYNRLNFTYTGIAQSKDACDQASKIPWVYWGEVVRREERDTFTRWRGDFPEFVEAAKDWYDKAIALLRDPSKMTEVPVPPAKPSYCSELICSDQGPYCRCSVRFALMHCGIDSLVQISREKRRWRLDRFDVVPENIRHHMKFVAEMVLAVLESMGNGQQPEEEGH